MVKNLIPYIKICPNYFSVFYRPENPKPRFSWSDIFANHKKMSMDNLNDNNSEGILSRKASKSLKLAVNWLEFLSKNQKVFCAELNRDIKFKLNFITLTLPVSQIAGYCDNYGNYTPCDNATGFVPLVNAEKGVFDFHYSDEYCKKELLNHFLVILRRKYNVHNYVWRAESQKNGNIHFHITLNKFIYLKDLRNTWNGILAKTDMIQRYHEKFSKMNFREYYNYRKLYGNPNYSDIKKAYENGCLTDWQEPNTTDIHAVWKIKNIAAYLCEYLSKNNSNYRKITGFLWRSSMLLAKLKSTTEVISNRVDDEIRKLWECYQNRIKSTDWASIFLFSIKDLFYMNRNSVIVNLFRKYKDSVFNVYKKNYALEI